ncbi:low molecular weight protein-tyrosine-phosphatase [Konateibacter massiliensis]|uniref:low molecular weight protein-tyrosine-phosphatase n=1 Tax=Konateibacter massiliensis TaxID=2002841 RepID=UPI000C14F9B1|nr:low molecular weight protein-tyrosine-phosphatase [Konateibacter massiliensis]
MTKILFVCHGNICRSPMAEFVLKDMVEKEDLSYDFHIASAATSREEIGNPVHSGTRNKLRQHGISTEGKYAIQLTKKDAEQYDYIIGMDAHNITNIKRIIGEDYSDKVFRLLDITSAPRDIADPWYTGDFEQTYRDVYEGCQALLGRCLSK